jgi:hypothetical protein
LPPGHSDDEELYKKQGDQFQMVNDALQAAERKATLEKNLREAALRRRQQQCSSIPSEPKTLLQQLDDEILSRPAQAQQR